MSLINFISGAFCQDESTQLKRDTNSAGYSNGMQQQGGWQATQPTGPRRYGEEPRPKQQQQQPQPIPQEETPSSMGAPPSVEHGMPPPAWPMAATRSSEMPVGRVPSGGNNPADTTVGPGFTARLRRGLAQAAPKDESRFRPEEHLVAQQEGGFIATIQRGFEGIFGHSANSMEEVLKQRGLMLASEYEPVPGDDVDAQVQNMCQKLPQHLGDCLKIYRVTKGQYEVQTVEDRPTEKVHIMFHSWQRPEGVLMREVFAQPLEASDSGEDGESIPKGPLEPLDQYLYCCANVAYNLQSGHAAVAQVPSEHRMSFADVRGTSLQDGDSDAKITAMEVATSQAKKREQHAQEWRKGSKEREKTRTISSGSIEANEITSAHSSSNVADLRNAHESLSNRDLTMQDMAAHEMLRGGSVPHPSRMQAVAQPQVHQMLQQQQQQVLSARVPGAAMPPGWGTPKSTMQAPIQFPSQVPVRSSFPVQLPQASAMQYPGAMHGVPVAVVR